MIRRPPRSTLDRSSAASDVYKRQILDIFRKENLSPEEVEMVLVACHGPFAWGKDAAKAVYNAAVLEELAKMAYLTPVSYTHLRAHETVLDLVCRLLLETTKQKTTKKQKKKKKPYTLTTDYD